ncbi:sigma-70 family RNA polymerase sigma factor [Paenibacillus sp. NEAU-GSW1]|uniref:sigma-70 family RNA polymerase sigma factor n=1 Tax=Paenibacillus sp. NEAU-GSW1 TaxID=2682486 RepID=UPI0012E1B18F|nr:sigma-70 family RNA polymerase sigma factor [Paenibacillus sp. NEAU-GSW1]MUT64964.1 sigma-70 family RNA polymerase sigma factor [Paenibacillus sp. NEAU-GSW1]
MDKDEWAAAAVKGDEEALLKRIGLDKQQMYGIAFSYMRNEADTLEAIQETVCRVWAGRRKLREPKYFTTWMMRILIRVCLDERRKKQRERAGLLEQIESQSNESAADRSAARLDMEARLAILPAKYRMVIVLKYYRDMTITEIAELLEKPDGTIRTWLNKALRLLRSDIELLMEGGNANEQGLGNGKSRHGVAE